MTIALISKAKPYHMGIFMTDVLRPLAAPAQETLAGWHRFVETKSEDVLRPLFAEDTVFRSPFAHIPFRAVTPAC